MSTETAKLPNSDSPVQRPTETKKPLNTDSSAQPSTETGVELDVSSLFQRLTDLEKENTKLRQYLKKAYDQNAWANHYASERICELNDQVIELQAANEQLCAKLAKARKALVETDSPPASPTNASWWQGPLPITADSL
jgi:hypothetical protein